jgi:hypothetical protein
MPRCLRAIVLLPNGRWIHYGFMGDDRILLIPPFVAPDPVTVVKWRAYPALMERLRALLPLDVLCWPTLNRQHHGARALESIASQEVGLSPSTGALYWPEPAPSPETA